MILLEDMRMPTRTVELTEDQAELVERLVRSVRYRSANDVVSDGLDLLIACRR